MTKQAPALSPMPTSDHTDSLREDFRRAWQDLRVHQPPAFAELEARYREPHRAYHNLEHIRACLAWLRASQHLAERPDDVALALLYHDIVYAPQRGDNEQQSAAFFRRHAQASRLPADAARRIGALIESTAAHRGYDTDSALLNDIDLAILGAPPHQFADYERRIRAEFAHVEDRAFAAGREHVLRSILETTAIYATAYFSDRLERQARTNLSLALDVLQAGDVRRRD